MTGCKLGDKGPARNMSRNLLTTRAMCLYSQC